MEIGAGAVEHATLPVLLEGDLDAMSAQVIKRGSIIVVRDGEGMMYSAMIVRHGIDRNVALYQDEASANRIEEHHLSVRRGRQMPAPDDLCIEFRALRRV